MYFDRESESRIFLLVWGVGVTVRVWTLTTKTLKDLGRGKSGSEGRRAGSTGQGEVGRGSHSNNPHE